MNYWQLIESPGLKGPKEDDGGGFTVYTTVPVAPDLLELTWVPKVATTILSRPRHVDVLDEITNGTGPNGRAKHGVRVYKRR